jgi:protein TonB
LSFTRLDGIDAVKEYGEKAKFGVIIFKTKKEQIIEVREKYYTNAEDVPYGIIEEAPVFPGCTGDKETLKNCFNTKLGEYVASNFNKDIAKTLNLEPGKVKIYILLKILKSGEIEIVGVRAPHPTLDKEARRVVSLLPKMVPGKHSGKEVNVTYMLPISLNIEGTFDPSKKYYDESKTPDSAIIEMRE